MTIKLAKVVRTCSGCPDQWDAWDTEGRYYYLRHRHQRGTVEPQPSPDTDTWAMPPGSAELIAWTDHHIGISLDEFLENADLHYPPGIMLAPGATVIGEDPLEDDMTDLAEHDPAPAAPAAPETAQALTEPEMVSEGTYRIYRTPTGALHIAYRTAESTEDAHFEIQPFIVKLAEQAMNGETPSLLTISKLFTKAGRR